VSLPPDAEPLPASNKMQMYPHLVCAFECAGTESMPVCVCERERERRSVCVRAYCKCYVCVCKVHSM